MSRSVCFALLVLAGIIPSDSACSCLFQTIQQIFCKADFAGAFRIEDNGPVIDGTRVYEVEMLAMYRTVSVKHLDTEKLYAPTAIGGGCGVIFRPDAYYIVSGYYYQNPGQLTQMRTSRCSLKIFWPHHPVPIYVPPDCDTTELEIKSDRPIVFQVK
ncbi:uncharacterized protein LOC128550128 [Mercenaria mercenaria]|uniref:uncharacterized protein LOC128550128 n=1 Tax=Mercenaria mercenaria TaxID=6596 RepID=UPI00234E44CA|nr:uncharacterized protein LOC128550128 [Mercenaria mercenaria]